MKGLSDTAGDATPSLDACATPDHTCEVPQGTRQQKKDKDKQHWVMKYVCQVNGFGLMAENFHDAWREGDGGRLLRCQHLSSKS